MSRPVGSVNKGNPPKGSLPKAEQDDDLRTQIIAVLKKNPRAHIAPKDYEWTTDFSDGRMPTEEEAVAMLDKLSPRQVTYVVIRTRLSRSVAMRTVGVQPKDWLRVAAWEESPWWQPALRREWDRLLVGKKDFFEPMLPAAHQRLAEEVMGLHGDKLAHDASVFVVEQSFGRANATTPTGEDARAPTTEADDVATAFVELIKKASEANQRERDAINAEVRLLPDATH